MSEPWRELRVGDRVKVVRVPSAFAEPGYRVEEETIALYRHLAAAGMALTIEAGSTLHTLALNDDSSERVAGGTTV